MKKFQNNNLIIIFFIGLVLAVVFALFWYSLPSYDMFNVVLIFSIMLTFYYLYPKNFMKYIIDSLWILFKTILITCLVIFLGILVWYLLSLDRFNLSFDDTLGLMLNTLKSIFFVLSLINIYRLYINSKTNIEFLYILKGPLLTLGFQRVLLFIICYIIAGFGFIFLSYPIYMDSSEADNSSNSSNNNSYNSGFQSNREDSEATNTPNNDSNNTEQMENSNNMEQMESSSEEQAENSDDSGIVDNDSANPVRRIAAAIMSRDVGRTVEPSELRTTSDGRYYIPGDPGSDPALAESEDSSEEEYSSEESETKSEKNNGNSLSKKHRHSSDDEDSRQPKRPKT